MSDTPRPPDERQPPNPPRSNGEPLRRLAEELGRLIGRAFAEQEQNLGPAGKRTDLPAEPETG
jgi:hypothetical protein